MSRLLKGYPGYGGGSRIVENHVVASADVLVLSVTPVPTQPGQIGRDRLDERSEKATCSRRWDLPYETARAPSCRSERTESLTAANPPGTKYKNTAVALDRSASRRLP